jgi:hypothetical protein
MGGIILILHQRTNYPSPSVKIASQSTVRKLEVLQDLTFTRHEQLKNGVVEGVQVWIGFGVPYR